MPNQIQKSFQDYISKMKQHKPSSQNHQYPATPRSISSSTSWILRGCKHPRTPSFSSSENHGNVNRKETSNATSDRAAAGEATLADVDQYLSENFKTVYENEEEDQEDQDITEMMIKTRIAAAADDDVDQEEKVIPNSGKMPARRINPSHQFYSSRTTAANSTGSITSDDISSSSTTTAGTSTRTGDHHGGGRGEPGTEQLLSPDDFITVLTYSPNPYDDFKKSMQEMVDARLQHNGKINWEFMEELLFCYLNLNDKKSHRFILRAFVDLIVILRENQGRIIVPKPANPPSFPTKASRRSMRNH